VLQPRVKRSLGTLRALLYLLKPAALRGSTLTRALLALGKCMIPCTTLRQPCGWRLQRVSAEQTCACGGRSPPD